MGEISLGAIIGALIWWAASSYLDRNGRNIYLAWIPIFLLSALFIGHTYYIRNFPSNTVGFLPPDDILNPQNHSTWIEDWKNHFFQAHPFINALRYSPYGTGILFGPPVKRLIQLGISKLSNS